MESMAGLKDASVVVTGGTGFIGGHLVARLVDLGANVIVLDIAVDPRSTFVRDKIYKKVELELVDIRDKKEVKRVFSEYNPSAVFHLAAEPIVELAFESPHSTFETNVMGTVNILEAARTSPYVKKVIVASSDKAYGKTKDTYTENSPLRGDHPYDVSKSSADLISQAYYKTYGLPIFITRFGNVYGEGDIHLNRIIPGICEAIVKNKTLLIRSNGKYVRDYLYVKDVVEGYIFLSQKNTNFGDAFNFSSPDNLSVLEVISIAQKTLKSKITYKILNNAKNEIPYQHLNDQKIKKMGWKNRDNLISALPSVLKWYTNNL